MHLHNVINHLIDLSMHTQYIGIRNMEMKNANQSDYTLL